MIDPSLIKITHHDEDGISFLIGSLTLTAALQIDPDSILGPAALAHVTAEAQRKIVMIIFAQLYGDIAALIHEIHQAARDSGEIRILSLIADAKELLTPKTTANPPSANS